MVILELHHKIENSGKTIFKLLTIKYRLLNDVKFRI